jgi:hypothetical protein
MWWGEVRARTGEDTGKAPEVLSCPTRGRRRGYSNDTQHELRRVSEAAWLRLLPRAERSKRQARCECQEPDQSNRLNGTRRLRQHRSLSSGRYWRLWWRCRYRGCCFRYRGWCRRSRCGCRRSRCGCRRDSRRDDGHQSGGVHVQFTKVVRVGAAFPLESAGDFNPAPEHRVGHLGLFRVIDHEGIAASIGGARLLGDAVNGTSSRIR